jgi:hypothetical protein
LQKTSVLDNRTSYRGFKGSFELVGIRATDFASGFSPSNVVFGDQIAFEDRSFYWSCWSFLPPNGASEAKSPEVNVLEHANRSQHAKIFWVQVFSFGVIVIYILRSNLPTNYACQGLTEHKHELKGPLATSFRKGISSENSSVFDHL